MILISGATGFVGSHLLVGLEELSLEMRVLLHPSQRDPDLPAHRTFDVTLASLSDRRGLRAAMTGVDTIIHLASAAALGHQGNLIASDVRGTEYIVAAAADAGARRFLFLSHLGASPASAFPLLQAKALAEEYIRRSTLDHCILRCGIVFGEGDRFTTSIARTMSSLPAIYPIPGDGSTLLHPLWISDLTALLKLLVESEDFPSGTHEIGGPEHLSLRQIVVLVAEALGTRRRTFGTHPAYLRGMIWLMERLLPRPPFTVHDIDYVASNRTTALDSMARLARIQPSRMQNNLGYLHRRSWSLLGRRLRSRKANES
jgi:NADH dehydrogenase